MPSISAELASVVCQVSTALCPALMVSGWAVMFAVGAAAAGGGGGGGGGATFFLWQPAMASMAASPATRTTARRLAWFLRMRTVVNTDLLLRIMLVAADGPCVSVEYRQPGTAPVCRGPKTK